MAALVDANVLVHAVDGRHPEKQARAWCLLLKGVRDDSVRVPHQAIVEFVAATTRRLPEGGTILPLHYAQREAEEMLAQFTVLHPNDEVVRTALRRKATYRLSWYDAHLWAYAEVFGLPEILSENFQHGRRYGMVTVTNPFL